MLILIWLSLLASSHAETALERLCFHSASEAQRALPIVATVLVKGVDTIQQEGDCLNVQVSPKRGDVFQRWVKMRLPHAQVTFSTLNAPKKECDMLAERITTKAGNGRTAMVNGQEVRLQGSSSSGSEVQQNILKVTSGTAASLSMDGNELTITCTELAEERFRLKFEHKYVPRTTPAVVNGQVVQLPEAGVYPPSATSEIEAERGQRVDIGSISKELKEKDKTAGIPVGLEYQHAEGTVTTQWFLTIR